jgi:hypothetical protein
MKKYFFSLCCLVSLTATAQSTDVFKSVYQFSYWHGGMDRDSVVLIRTSPSEMYSKLRIYRNQRLKYESNDSMSQFECVPYGLFVEHEIACYKSYYYIFRLLNAPDPSQFLILYVTKDSITQFGITKPCTAEIFGDIDYDGKFEIGGLETYCEADDKTCLSKDWFSVFKIEKGFPIDRKLTEYLNPRLRAKKAK